MFCPNCASQNDASQHYCRACGLHLDAIAVDVATQRPSAKVARLLARKRKIELLGTICLATAGLIGLLFLLGQLFYEKLKVFGPDLVFGGASVALVVFAVASAALLSYPKFMMRFDKVTSPSERIDSPIEQVDTNKLISDPPFEPASVTEHSTELLRSRK